MLVVVLSLADPVSRTFLDLVGPLPVVESLGDVEVGKYRGVPVVIHRGEPTEFTREDVVERYGRWAVFISRHEMSNPRPMFTVHTPGTWPDVSVANPRLVSSLYRALCRLAQEPFTCAIEATHHPPNTSRISATFLEVGSTEAEWTSRKAAEALLAALEKSNNGRSGGVPTMVIGDLHYSTLGELVLGGGHDFGHVVPKYVDITAEAVESAYRKHTEQIRRVIMFRKNVKNPTRTHVVDFLKRQGVEVVLKG
ncbi:MAG: D-aminoacyl-tRNA deacylase [Pyrobaculum sp.]